VQSSARTGSVRHVDILELLRRDGDLLISSRLTLCTCLDSFGKSLQESI
jgi:hypothetical protein